MPSIGRRLKVVGIGIAACGSFALAVALIRAHQADTIPLKPALLAGSQAFYDVSYENESVYNTNAAISPRLPSSSKQLAFAVHGTLISTVVESGIKTTTVWRFLSPSFRWLTREKPALNETIEQLLVRPFVTVSDQDGKDVRTAGTHAGVDIADGIMQTIVSSLETTADTTGSKSWSSEEPDAEGSRTSFYALKDEGRETSMISFRRTRRFAREAQDGAISYPAVREEAVDDGVWNSDGYLAALDSGSQRYLTLFGTLVGKSHARLHARIQSRAVVDATRLSASRAYASKRLASNASIDAFYRPPDESLALQHLQESTLGNDDESSLVTKLSKIRGSDQNRNYALALKFSALFSLQPKTAVHFLPSLLSHPITSQYFGTIVVGLEGAQTVEAQDVLSTLIDERADEADMGSAVIAGLGIIKHPTMRLVSILEQVLNRRSSTVKDDAEVVLGVLASHLSREDGRRGIVALLEQRLRDGKTERAQQMALLAIGNASLPDSASVIEKYASSPSSTLRGAASAALGGFSDNASSDALSEKLRDRDETVRSLAAEAFTHRAFDLAAFHVLAFSAQTDKVGTVRLSSDRALWNAHEAYPAGIDLLRRLRVSDPDKRIRDYISGQLQTLN